MTLLTQYETAIIQSKIKDDSEQRAVLNHFIRLWNDINNSTGWFWQNPKHIAGIYLYGKIGAGKTFLMDLFYQAMSMQKCRRYHFHQFMQLIDSELQHYQGKEDPARLIAKTIANETKVLCLDEIMVKDIMQASLLTRLLEEFYKQKVILVMTSNIKPDDLYLGGLNRERFLPAIALIKQHCEVIFLQGTKDYRTGHLLHQKTYYTPLEEAATFAMIKLFYENRVDVKENSSILIQHRFIPYIRCAGKRIWFDFKVICQIPRCKLDYLELREQFDEFYISEIPKLKAEDSVAVLLLMLLVDILYDKRKRLIISAETTIQHLYEAGPMFGEFARTRSRLEEMQAEDYGC